MCRYTIKTPSIFTNRVAGVTPVNKTRGQIQSSDLLKGRVFEVSLGDLNKEEPEPFRKMKLRCDEVRGTECLTNFHGMIILLYRMLWDRYGYDSRQALLSNPQVANHDWGSRWCQGIADISRNYLYLDCWWLHCPPVRHCFHQACRKPSHKDVIRSVITDPRH